MSEILNLKDLKVYYPIRSGFFNRVTDNVLAVDGVDLTIHEGEDRKSTRLNSSH